MPSPQEALRVVIRIPELREQLSVVNPINENAELFDDWQKDEVVREVFDRMESNFATFLKNIQQGISPAHVCDREYTEQEIDAMNRVMVEIGCRCWFECSQNNLFKTQVSDDSPNGFIDTFPLFLDYVGEDYVILQHNEKSSLHVIGKSIFA
jgi:hypothetical protein